MPGGKTRPFRHRSRDPETFIKAHENNTSEKNPLNCVVVIVVLMINNWIWSSPNPHDLYGVMLQAQRGAAKDDSLHQEAEK